MTSTGLVSRVCIKSMPCACILRYGCSDTFTLKSRQAVKPGSKHPALVPRNDRNEDVVGERYLVRFTF